jgi:hypothetical protein
MLTAARVDGPAILFLDLSPRAALDAADTITDEITGIL